jgi:hypothetical protein
VVVLMVLVEMVVVLVVLAVLVSKLVMVVVAVFIMITVPFTILSTSALCTHTVRISPGHLYHNAVLLILLLTYQYAARSCHVITWLTRHDTGRSRHCNRSSRFESC